MFVLSTGQSHLGTAWVSNWMVGAFRGDIGGNCADLTDADTDPRRRVRRKLSGSSQKEI